MAGKTPKKSTLLAGGNPQIAKPCPSGFTMD